MVFNLIVYIWNFVWKYATVDRSSDQQKFINRERSTGASITVTGSQCFPWWRLQMETISVLLALCYGNLHRPVTRCFDIFFDLRLRLSTPSRLRDLRCHRAHYDITVIRLTITQWMRAVTWARVVDAIKCWAMILILLRNSFYKIVYYVTNMNMFHASSVDLRCKALVMY